MTMQQPVDTEVESDFNIHTSYHNDLFLLRTRVLVNGENTQISSIREGSYEKPVISFSDGSSTISTKLWLIANTISPVLHKCGVYHVDTFYYEQSPLFHVVFSSETCLKKFLIEISDVKRLMELELLSILSECIKPESSQQLATVVQPDLFFVSPNRQQLGEAEVHVVTAENCSTFVSHWKDSTLFNFPSLQWERNAAEWLTSTRRQCNIDGTSQTSQPVNLTIGELPRITAHPKELKEVVPGTPVKFTVQATGVEPLSYHWQQHTGEGSGRWQSCDVGSYLGANSSTLIIPSVEKLNKGLYCCVVSNIAGSQMSVPAKVTIAEPPRITAHPKEQKDTVLGKPVTFTVQATGTEPLNYQWEIYPRDGIGGWQPCDELPGGNSFTLMIPSVHKSNEGSYHCIISNAVGSQTSVSVILSTAEPPKISAHPEELSNVVPDTPVTFTVQATGTEPMNYHWQLHTTNESGEWQSCDVEKFSGVNSSTLIIPSVQRSNEGKYCCIISNVAGSQTSKPAKLSIAEPPDITTHPKDTVPGKPVSFTVKATGTEPLNYQWQWKPVVEGVSSGEWQNLSSGGSVEGVYTATLTYPSIESCGEGLYRCEVTNFVGKEVSHCADHIIGKITESRDLLNGLSTVSQWYLLGIYLGLPYSTLDVINADYKATKECRTQMLIEWQRHVTPTWTAVVKALVGIGRERLASHLAEIHGVFLPHTVDSKPLEKFEAKHKMTAGSDSTEVQYRKGEFQQLGGRLTEIEELLKASRDSQVPLNENVNNLVSELTKLGKEVHKIAQDTGNIESELQHRQRDSQLLSEMQKDLAHSIEKCQLLQQVTNKNEEEIKRLKEKVQKKKEQLQSTQQEAQKMKEKLSKLQIKLVEKHEEVKRLQKEKEELTRSYNTEREEAKKLIGITLSNRDEMEQQLITSKEESEHKSQQIAVCNSRISYLSEKVEALSSSLKEKEAKENQIVSAFHPYQRTSKQLSDVISLTIEIAQLKQRLQETEFQRQQNTLLREAAVQEVNAKKKVEMQLHRHLDEPPKLTGHPKSLKNAVPGKPVTFSIQAIGTECLTYQWQHKTGNQSEGWQLCDAEKFPGANSSTLTIPSVQKSNEGSYCCTVSNCAGSATSECAALTVAEPPTITTHPEDSRGAVPGKPVTFTVQVTGTEPLSYQWQQKLNIIGEWQACSSVEGFDSATLTIASVQQLNKGSYRCVVSNNAGRQASKPAILEMDPLSELTWRRLADMPYAMKYPQSVVIHGKVYVSEGGISRVIHKYHPQTQNWTELPDYQYYQFTMTEVNHQLTLVGGWFPGGTSNEVAVYSTSWWKHRWEQPYPPMNTPRHSPAVATYHEYLVVAGGNIQGPDLTAVEILDTSIRQWFSATPLPTSGSRMSSTILHHTLYLLGGSLDKQVLSVSLPALTQTSKPPTQWCTLSRTPLVNSAAIVFHGSLLAVGGSQHRRHSSVSGIHSVRQTQSLSLPRLPTINTAKRDGSGLQDYSPIYVYDHKNNEWNEVGGLPTARENCACCLLPSGEILVAGGRDRNDWTSRMDIAAV